MALVLAIDRGTTSSRAILFSEDMSIISIAQRELPQYYPAPGWVEHEPEDLWRSVLEVGREALSRAEVQPAEVAAIGITNQRETVLVSDRSSGQPIHRAIVWQDRRTAEQCHHLKAEGQEALVRSRTGLLLDPYFSGTKVAWLLDNVPDARTRAERGELLFGTVDTFLLWRLTGGELHATDATNASRTLLYDTHKGDWAGDLLNLLRIPRCMLPEVRDSSAVFGTCLPEHFGAGIAICGVAGDQQAATVGQACFRPGMTKARYGTGCFALLNTGEVPVASSNRLLTTIAYQIDGRPTYALEGSIFIAGAAIQWLRDGLGIIKGASESSSLAEEADPNQSVYLVPAFVGLGAPYWDADCRGALFRLTPATGPREIAHAALESVCFHTLDLLDAIHDDWSAGEGAGVVLRVDGGMVESDWMMQRLSDILGAPVDRPAVKETTALGAAYLAGLNAGIYPGPEMFADWWRSDIRFHPSLPECQRARKVKGWHDAVSRTLIRRIA